MKADLPPPFRMCILQGFGGIYFQRAKRHGKVMGIDKLFASEIECGHANSL